MERVLNRCLDLEKLRRAKLEISWAEYRKRKAAEAIIADSVQYPDGSLSDSGESGVESDWVANAGI